MNFIKRRLTHLEEHIRGGLCQKCGLPPDGPGRIVVFEDGTPAEGFPDDPGERCERCGRYLWCVVRIVYSEEGEGARADA
jgi:ribosomal protein L37E